MSQSLFSKLIPAPRLIDIPYAGLDITDDAVHLVLLAPGHSTLPSGRRSSKILAYVTRPLAEGMIEDGFVKDEAGVKTILADMLNEAKLGSGLHVRASLPEEKVYLFKTDLLSEDEKEIRQNIESKVEENVPVSTAEALFEVERTFCGDPVDSSPRPHAIVSVAPRKVVNAYLSVISGAGMVPIAFELQAKSLARALVQHPVGGVPDTHLIVHTIEKKTGLSIVCRGVVVFASTVKWGRSALTDAISASRSISREEAEKLKYTTQIHGGTELAKLSAIVEPTVAPLTDEIHRVYAYWMEHSDDNQEIRKVIFSGGDAELISLAANIPPSLGLTFSVADVWGNVFAPGTCVPPVKREDAFDYAAAIGLALP